MTAVERVRRTQRLLQGAAVASAMLWGGAAGVIALAIGSLARDGRATIGVAAVYAVAWTVAAVIAASLLWRARGVRSQRRVAVWIEERIPQLQYALVTASDPTLRADNSVLDAAVARADVGRVVTPAALRTPAFGGAALLVALGLLALASRGTRARVAIATHSALERVGVHTPLPNRLATLHVRITDPEYAGGRSHDLDDPSAATALVGSTVTVSGGGTRDGIGARFGGRALAPAGGRNDWRVTIAMPASAAMLTLTDRAYERSLAIIPIADRPPAVTLESPSRDTVWRTPPAGVIAFAARATDDIGLSSGRFEYTVTTGSGEVFKSRTGTFGEARFGRGTDGSLRADLPLTPLTLGEGDVLSVRAVVADGNTITGPGTATSDTRTFRVARAGEYDTVSVGAAPPPPVEKSFLTERMLIISAESLLKARPTIARPEFISSAGRIGFDQASLRKRVYDILYQQDEAGAVKGVEGDDEELDPQLVINRDLKEAYDAMWDAERSLNVGEIPQALPAMTRALHALDRARLANRLYLRGRTPRIVVDVEKARLTGKEKGVSSATTARPVADTLRRVAERELDAAAPLARTQPSAFVDALTRLRVTTVATYPAFATALGDVIDRARHGGDVPAALARARRILVGTSEPVSAPGPWSGAWAPGGSTR